MIANSNPKPYYRLSPDPNTAAPTIPVFSVPLSTYSLLSGAILLGSTLQMRIQTYTLPSCEPPLSTNPESCYVLGCCLPAMKWELQ